MEQSPLRAVAVRDRGKLDSVVFDTYTVRARGLFPRFRKSLFQKIAGIFCSPGRSGRWKAAVHQAGDVAGGTMSTRFVINGEESGPPPTDRMVGLFAARRAYRKW